MLNAFLNRLVRLLHPAQISGAALLAGSGGATLTVLTFSQPTGGIVFQGETVGLPPGIAPRCYRALATMFIDDLAFGRTEFEELLQQALDAGDEGSQAQIRSFLGALEMRGKERALELHVLEVGG